MRRARWAFAASAIFAFAAAARADVPAVVPKVTPWKPPSKNAPAGSVAVTSPPAAPTSTIAKPKVAWKPAPPPKPKLPAPDVTLAVDPRAYGEWWMMEVRNTGEFPLEIVADARLLRLEITAPSDPTKKGKPTTVTCELPSAMRSAERTLVLPPNARYLEAFDPRLYCMANTKEIADGATIVAHLGWKSNDLAPPYVVVPASADAKSKVASAKELAAPAFVVDKTKAKSLAVAPAAPLLPIEAKAGAPLTAYDEKGVTIHLSLTNEDAVTHALYPRPQLVGARVRNPRGTITVCGTWASTVTPIPDFIVHLKPKGVWHATVNAVDLCPPQTFDWPGLYEVTPFIRTPPLSPKVGGAVSGMFTAGAPQLVRVETGDQPFHDVGPTALTTSE